MALMGRMVASGERRDYGMSFLKDVAIFSIFRRLHSRKQYEGSGAGLTIVRKIVESHGGRVSARGRPGGGLAIEICIPRSARPDERDRGRGTLESGPVREVPDSFTSRSDGDSPR